MNCAECHRRARDWAWTDRGRYDMGWSCKDGFSPDDCPENIEEEDDD